jgi:hypothetical protein
MGIFRKEYALFDFCETNLVEKHPFSDDIPLKEIAFKNDGISVFNRFRQSPKRNQLYSNWNILKINVFIFILVENTRFLIKFS